MTPFLCPLPSSLTLFFRQRENLSFYLHQIQAYGVSSSDLFDISDLYDGKNINMVLTHINALANLCEAKPDWKGPFIANTSQAKNLLGDALLGTLPYPLPSTF